VAPAGQKPKKWDNRGGPPERPPSADRPSVELPAETEEAMGWGGSSFSKHKALPPHTVGTHSSHVSQASLGSLVDSSSLLLVSTSTKPGIKARSATDRISSSKATFAWVAARTHGPAKATSRIRNHPSQKSECIVPKRGSPSRPCHAEPIAATVI